MHVEWQVLLANYFGRLALGKVVGTRHSLFSISIQYSVFSTRYSVFILGPNKLSANLCRYSLVVFSLLFSSTVCIMQQISYICSFRVTISMIFYFILRVTITYQYLKSVEAFLYFTTVLIVQEIHYICSFRVTIFIIIYNII